MRSQEMGVFAAIRELHRQHPYTLFNAQFVMWVFSFFVGSTTSIQSGSIVRSAFINLAIQVVIIALVLARYMTPFRPLPPEVTSQSVRTLLLISAVWMCAAFALILASRDTASTPLMFDMLIAFQLVAAWLGTYGIYWFAAKWCCRSEAT